MLIDTTQDVGHRIGALYSLPVQLLRSDQCLGRNDPDRVSYPICCGPADTCADNERNRSPYFQFTESTESPGVFSDSVGQFDNDPIFPDDTCAADDLMCNFSWAVQIYSTTNLTISGAGLYSW